MAEETKKTTTRKTSTSTKKTTKKEETTPVVENDLQAQMQQMMAMMMAQQQQLMELMNKTNDVEQQVVQDEKPRKTKRERKDKGMNKQDLRRKYKNTDIYLTNVSQGEVMYQGKNNLYHWENNGDTEVINIDDVINMPKSFLHCPWLVIDEYENDEELVEDLITVLKLESVYEYIYILQDMDEDINDVDIDDIKKMVNLSKKRGEDLTMDIVVLVERKIRSKELTNYHKIAELGELLGRKFM